MNHTLRMPDMTTGSHTVISSPRYNLRTHRVPDLPAPLPEDNVRRFTRAFYCRVILPLAAKTGMAWGRTETWLRKTAEKFKAIKERTFESYLAELLAVGWIEYQIDDRGIVYINPLYCPPGVRERRSTQTEPPASWARDSSAAKVFAARIAPVSEAKTPVSCTVFPYIASGEDLEKENRLTKTESVTVPAQVVRSFALQREKEKIPDTRQGQKIRTLANVNTPPSRRSETVTEAVQETKPLDLPAAAAYLVGAGKIAAKIVLRHIRKAGRDIVDRACAAFIEYEEKKPVICPEKLLWRAVDEEWEPSAEFTLPYRAGAVSADYVKPAADAPAADWPGASEKRLHSPDSQFSSTEGRMVRCAGKHRALVMRMVNWIFREPQGRPDDDAEWVAVARSVVKAGSYLHLPMDWVPPTVEGVK